MQVAVKSDIERIMGVNRITIQLKHEKQKKG